MDVRTGMGGQLGEEVEEGLAVVVGVEARTAAAAPVHEGVVGAGVVQSGETRHRGSKQGHTALPDPFTFTDRPARRIRIPWPTLAPIFRVVSRPADLFCLFVNPAWHSCHAAWARAY